MRQGQFQQPPVQEEQDEAHRKAAIYLRPSYLLVLHPLCPDARQGEKHHRKKFRPQHGREQPGGTLEFHKILSITSKVTPHPFRLE